jgi:molybdate transport system ATP-binding protein
VLKVRAKKRLGDFSVDVDFMLPAKGLTVFFGKSGAGKTSIVNMIAGLVSPDEGRISYGKRVFFDSEEKFSLSPERRGLGYVFQQHRLFSHMSVKNNLLFAPRFCGRPDGARLFEKVVDLLGIAHLLSRRPGTLSGGESQRVSIGRALLACTSFLLMDEPLSSLDDERRNVLMGYIAAIPSDFGVSIIYVTHSQEELSRLADRVLVVDGGRAAPPCSPLDISL